ncbi:hypothetical protein I3842_09G185100 [Carya illinoinensis]|uniref:Secreted protein n=1 Tax=Carya illinoinensis TaxID=32201 RepID=A0A922J8P0_CARIL|nr:hypothetical protein I3842_09G185100 [Carya illinoinensis]
MTPTLLLLPNLDHLVLIIITLLLLSSSSSIGNRNNVPYPHRPLYYRVIEISTYKNCKNLNINKKF